MGVKFKFGLEAKVEFCKADWTGTVVGLHYDRDESKYAVVQYADTTGQVHEQYIRESDLGAVT